MAISRVWDDALKSYVLKVEEDIRKIEDSSLDVHIKSIAKAEMQAGGGKADEDTGEPVGGEPVKAEQAPAASDGNTPMNASPEQGGPQDVEAPASQGDQDPGKDQPKDEQQGEGVHPDKQDKQEGENKSEAKPDKKDEGKNPKPTNENVFDRWDIEVYDHLVFFVNKKHKELYIRFAHSKHVPNLHVYLNTNDAMVVADVAEDMMFMSATNFRTEQIDPLIEETYKAAA